SNLQRNLYYATQVLELGRPTLIALNMIDVAESNGQSIDTEKLAAELGVPVVPIIASEGNGVPELREKAVGLLRSKAPSPPRRFCAVPDAFTAEAELISQLLAKTFEGRRVQSAAEALLILSNEKALDSSAEDYPNSIQQAVRAGRRRLEAAGVDWRGGAIEGRYATVAAIQQAVTTQLATPGETA